MSLTSYRAAPPRVNPCVSSPASSGSVVPPISGFWRAGARDGYVTRDASVGKSLRPFFGRGPGSRVGPGVGRPAGATQYPRGGNLRYNLAHGGQASIAPGRGGRF